MECGGRSKGSSPASNGSSVKEYRRHLRRGMVREIRMKMNGYNKMLALAGGQAL